MNIMNDLPNQNSGSFLSPPNILPGAGGLGFFRRPTFNRRQFNPPNSGSPFPRIGQGAVGAPATSQIPSQTTNPVSGATGLINPSSRVGLPNSPINVGGPATSPVLWEEPFPTPGGGINGGGLTQSPTPGMPDNRGFGEALPPPNTPATPGGQQGPGVWGATRPPNSPINVGSPATSPTSGGRAIAGSGGLGTTPGGGINGGGLTQTPTQPTLPGAGGNLLNTPFGQFDATTRAPITGNQLPGAGGTPPITQPLGAGGLTTTSPTGTTAPAGTPSLAGTPSISNPPPGTYGNFALTGGFSPGDISNYQSMIAQPFSGYYDSVKQMMDRNKTVQGGYSPGEDAATQAAARQALNSMSSGEVQGQSTLANMIRQNQLAGLGGLTTMYGTAPGEVTALNQAMLTNQGINSEEQARLLYAMMGMATPEAQGAAQQDVGGSWQNILKMVLGGVSGGLTGAGY